MVNVGWYEADPEGHVRSSKVTAPFLTRILMHLLTSF